MDYYVKVFLYVRPEQNEGTIDHTNLLLSVQSEHGQINNFSYFPEFKVDDESAPGLNLTSHTQAISLPYGKKDIKLVKFYSNSTSTDTFFVFKIVFYPTFMGEMVKSYYSTFYSFQSSEHYDKPMSHNTWYTLDVNW